MSLPSNGKELWRKGRALASSLLKPKGDVAPADDAAFADFDANIRKMAEALGSLNKRRLCPVCLNQIASYARYNRRRNVSCSGCGSKERHRMAWLYLKNETPLFRKPTRLLHFAPEPFFASRIDRYMTIDQVKASYDPDKPDEGVDIQRLPFEDESFDMIFCSHVLEHVPDDRLAMRELLRVLRPDGLATILVPIRADLTETYEDATITTPEGRAEHFGQWDHLRWYGRDFPDRMREQGFLVDVVHYADEFTPEEQVRYGIRPEPLFACRKPNG